MIDIASATNEPLEVNISGVTLKLRQLSIGELFGYFSQKVKSELIRDGLEIADSLSGSERLSFLSNMHRSLPTGSDLIDKSNERMETIEGIKELFYLSSRDYDEDITIDSFNNLITLNNLDDMAMYVTWIAGIDSELKLEDNGENTKDDTKEGESTKSKKKTQ